jgi:hypothetical protein
MVEKTRKEHRKIRREIAAERIAAICGEAAPDAGPQAP